MSDFCPAQAPGSKGRKKTEKKTQENERKQENKKKVREHEKARWKRRQEGRWSKSKKGETKRDQYETGGWHVIQPVWDYSGYSSNQLAAGWPWRFRVERHPLSCIAAQQAGSKRLLPTCLPPSPPSPAHGHRSPLGLACRPCTLSRYRIHGEFNTGVDLFQCGSCARTDGNAISLYQSLKTRINGRMDASRVRRLDTQKM
ncbi:hypothetical protein DFH08DRAFT_984145 [Mycena albidolilacea]|uniref:Uncharacterized protein n=1 Tax=Mycena albidolilacea TaxID=1033008 RepID=A0AAD7AWM9_9AGAR|nr:hypothetical protein DFH08DRAFT_984145 [Mycena albidolilacea]